MTRTTPPPSIRPLPFWGIFTLALIAILLALFQTATAQEPPDSTALWYAAGVKINQGKTYGTIGTVIKISNSLYNFTGTDLGGDEASAQTYILLRLSHIDHFTLFALAGPNVEKVYSSRADDDPINYLTAATGAVISYRASQTVRVWGMISYLFTDGNIRHWKYGLGISSPLDFSR